MLSNTHPCHPHHAPRCCRYRREWENHVLSNLPFYTLLLPLFLEMCISRLEVRWAACWGLWALTAGCAGA